VKVPDRKDAIDVMIIASEGVVGDLARDLCQELEQRGRRVRLNLLSPAERTALLPATCVDAARRSRFCVVLASVGHGIQYALMPAPKFPGQEPTFARVGTTAQPGEVEVGVFSEGIGALAGRIERLLNH
jgi:hypothetical protein